MIFELNPQQQKLQAQFREFAQQEVAPIAAEIDENARFPRETIEKIGQLGWMSLPFPKEYGGYGADYVSYAIMIEELSKACASTGVIVQTHHGLCTWPILTYGTEEQKKKYLPPLMKGEKIGAFGLTEPNAGTDAAGQETIAEDKGDHWLLNGQKKFISNSGVAGTYVIMAMTDKSKGTKGISAFIVEDTFQGFRVGKSERKMGIKGSVARELFFEDCIVPKENLLGKLGQGFKVAMTSLDVGRIGIASQALGIAQGALDVTLDYVKNRKQFGKAIAEFQGPAFELAQMRTRIDAARFLVYNAAYRRETGKPSTVEAAQAKYFASETAMYVTTKAVQLHGGYGYLQDYPVERMMRDAKITEIYEGTSEVMKMVISGSMIR
ncbi:acyl-CoA dehydrogenase [Clostridium aminobutyricum]|uniref:Acyl-CoA dehydrogenase n=1 Tax=Clostridium aminobutyricum TaxID=33953 RepID=A0A939IHI1_CLOAM|nr:acyl-CoA dehydrogenase [Clostridium aminobutyricum]MBN7771986.1 acyl-CoA dehydrogenase [Clostridium aminobutyricum]